MTFSEQRPTSLGLNESPGLMGDTLVKTVDLASVVKQFSMRTI